MNLEGDQLEAFVDFREEVVTPAHRIRIAQARDRAHILVGLPIAVVNIDQMIELIRRAPDPVMARERLMERAWPIGDLAPLLALVDEPEQLTEDGHYRLSETQAGAILELRLQRLTGLERDKIAGCRRRT